MSPISILIGFVAVAGIAVIAFAMLKALMASQSGQAGKGPPEFKAKPFLTPNELEFLGRLEAAVPEYRFHGQVAMGALLDPAVSRKDGKEYFRLRGMISQKVVDFVAQSRQDGKIKAIIELDDRTHDSEKDAKRDAMLASAGFQTVRWNSKTKPDIAAIRARLVPALGAIEDLGYLSAKSAIARTSPQPH